MERGPAARAAARVLLAHQGTARSRQGDRRDRPQARDPVLVQLTRVRGLRPPAALPDPKEAPPPGDHRRRTQIHPPSAGIWSTNDLMRESRARTRPPSRNLIPADVQDQQAGAPERKSGRERDTGARIGLVTQTRTSRAADQARDVCSSLRHRPAPTNNLRGGRPASQDRGGHQPANTDNTNLTFLLRKSWGGGGR